MKAKSSMVTHLSKREFKEKVFDYSFSKDWKYKGQMPAVVDFYADWCAPCKMVSPILDDLSHEYTGRIKVYKVNTEKEPEVARAFGISSIPTIMFIPQEGKPMVVRGAQSRSSLKGNFERILTKDEKPLFRRLLSMKW
jgi:thioredoxin 1